MDTREAPVLSGDEVYLRYVSPLLEARLRDPRPVVVPEVTRTLGAVALIDVERWSAFAERMAARGNDGVEKLADRINATFAVLVEAIVRYGGIAHAFPGDSVVAFWPAETRSMEDSALSASRCCLELLEIHRDDELPLKAGLSVGEFSLAHLGGVQGRLQLLLSGKALDEMGRAEERSSRGRLIVAAPAWNLLSAHAVAAVESDGFYEIKTLRTAAPQAAPASATGPGPSAVDVHAARAYLPAALLRQLDAGHRSWLGEFREVTTTFIQVRSGRGPDTDMAEVQKAFASVQAAVFRHGGDITRFAHDDKGLAVLAVFGLPPASREDSATRAVEASVDIERDARRDAWRCRIGVATGRVFCGTLGAPGRREFSVVGSTPNLAARLMLSLDGGVLCDAATRQASNCSFESAGRLRPKGFPEAQEVFRPSAVAEGTVASEPLKVAGRLVGREVDLHHLEAWMDRLREHGVSSVLVVEGEAGIGKTTLVRQALETARAGGVEILLVPCRAAEATAGYAAWGRALTGLLRLDRVAGADERIALLEGSLAAAGVNPQLSPLVGPVVGIPIEDNAVTLAMSGAMRADNLLAVLSRLVSWLAARRRELGGTLAVVFEDVHWMDLASWGLVGVLGRSLGPTSLGLLLTLRSQTLAEQGEAEAILATLPAERVVLGALSPGQTREFACRLLHARELDPHLAEITFERTRGNPFFCEQLVLALVESGLVGMEDGIALLRGRNPEEAEALVPRTVAAVLTGRLDRLPAPVLLTLKVASVVGSGFLVSLLTAVHPMRHHRDTVLAHLAAAADVGIVAKDRDDPSIQRFRHALTGDVAYDLLLASQQRQLHREVAEVLTASEDFPAARSVLFHHWRRSGDEAGALRHVDQAGAEAMRNGNYHAVVEMYGYALKTLASGQAGVAPQEAADHAPRAARWAAHLGQAQVAIGLHEAARPNLEQCLIALGEWVPATTPALAAATAGEA
ncbi:MAG: AAA family ATPase, partial [Candidatus Binatia bacterium]